MCVAVTALFSDLFLTSKRNPFYLMATIYLSISFNLHSDLKLKGKKITRR